MRKPKGRDYGEEHVLLYDKNNKLKYIFKQDYNKGDSPYNVPVEVYDSEGNVVRHTTGSCYVPGSNDLDDFKIGRGFDRYVMGIYEIND